MPGFNRTGPAGYGPMTGRGAGDCSGYDRNVDRQRFFSSSSRSRRRYLMDDRGICRGIRRRFRDRFSASPGYYGRQGKPMGYSYGEYSEDYPAEADREQYQKMLKEEAAYLQQELKSIEKRIEELKTAREES